MKLPEELVSLLSDPETPNSVLQDLLTDLEGKVDVAEVFIVVGSTGAYSDYREWYVTAFLSKDKARKLCKQANNWLRKHNIHSDDSTDTSTLNEGEKNPYDPDGEIDDFYGANYQVVTVPLKG